MRNNGLSNGFTHKTRIERADEAAAVSLGELLKQAAINQVETNASPNWKKDALAAVYKVAESRLTFTTDDIWAELGGNVPREGRAMGAIMRQAAKLRYCSVTETTQKTERASNHRRPLAIWMSLLFRASKAAR